MERLDVQHLACKEICICGVVCAVWSPPIISELTASIAKLTLFVNHRFENDYDFNVILNHVVSFMVSMLHSLQIA